MKRLKLEGLVGHRGETEDEALGGKVNLTGTLVAELAADKTAVTVFLVLGHLPAETEGAGGQRVAELLAETLDGRGHHVPVVLAAKKALGGGGTLVESDAGVQDTGIDDVLPDAVNGTDSEAFKTELLWFAQQLFDNMLRQPY